MKLKTLSESPGFSMKGAYRIHCIVRVIIWDHCVSHDMVAGCIGYGIGPLDECMYQCMDYSVGPAMEKAGHTWHTCEALCRLSLQSCTGEWRC